MRALHLVAIAAMLAIPTVGYAQADGPVGGKVGPNLESSLPAQPGASLGTQSYGSRPPGPPQERAGYAGSVSPGQVVPHDTPVTQQWGGAGTAIVNGHRVKVDPNTGRIMRVIN
jgi:hypothetical protein